MRRQAQRGDSKKTISTLITNPSSNYLLLSQQSPPFARLLARYKFQIHRSEQCMDVLVFNSPGNPLKAELVLCKRAQKYPRRSKADCPIACSRLSVSVWRPLGGAQTVIFGGGTAENTPLVRHRVCDGLRWCGLEMDENSNRTLIDSEGRLSTEGAAIQALVIPVEEGLQIAPECVEEIT